MTTPLIRPTASVTIDGEPFHLRRGSSCSLDSGRVPYAEGTLQLPMLEEATLAALDPRAGARVVISHAIDGGTPRTFDLAVKRLSANHGARTVALQLASDEVLLQKYRALATDAGARAHETSARAVVDYVLALIGAALEPGADDADVTAYWPVTNLINNNSFELNATGWANGSNATGLDRNNTRAYVGSYSMIWQSVSAGVSFASLTDRLPVRAGRPYVFTARLGAGAARNMRLMVRWHNSAGTIVAADSYSSAVLAPAAGFLLATHLVTAPAGAEQASVHIEHQASAGAQNAFADMVMFYEGDEIISEFNGDTVDDAFYNYAWAGAAGASASTRTPVLERLPEVFVWKPGVSAWDFLIAITASAGLVLWCDEQRKWWLSTPEHRTLPTLISVAEGNTSDGSDAIDLDDDETTPTGVVVKFTWTDSNGDRHEEYDSAGDPERAALIELTDRAYPGSGIAGAILARRQGTGRRQDVTTITQLSTTPGMTAQVSLPAAPDTTGRVASVEFDLGEGFMTLGLAGLVDLIPGSIGALVGTIDDLVGTIDSL